MSTTPQLSELGVRPASLSPCPACPEARLASLARRRPLASCSAHAERCGGADRDEMCQGPAQVGAVLVEADTNNPCKLVEERSSSLRAVVRTSASVPCKGRRAGGRGQSPREVHQGCDEPRKASCRVGHPTDEMIALPPTFPHGPPTAHHSTPLHATPHHTTNKSRFIAMTSSSPHLSYGTVASTEGTTATRNERLCCWRYHLDFGERS